MTRSPVLLHIGYHKTATTWMQRKLFLPEHGYYQLLDHAQAWTHIVRPHGLLFDPAPVRALIDQAIAEMPAGLVPVISSEILSGHPFQGGRESGILAHRLAEILPEAQILISIRNQLRILPSVYMQYVLRGGTEPPAPFFQGTSELGYVTFAPEHFEYHRLIGLYRTLFGTERVHVMTQESLRKGGDDALLALARFAGNDQWTGLSAQARKPEHESYPEFSTGILRRINHVQSSTLNPWPIITLGHTPRGLYKLAGYLSKQPVMQRLFGGHKPVSAYVARTFPGHYAASNRELARMMGERLDLTGYDGIDPARS